MVINPQSQTLAVYQGASVLVAPTFVDDINPNGPNRIQLVRALRAIVHENATVEEALAIVGE